MCEALSDGCTLEVCGGIERWRRTEGMRRYQAPEVCVRHRAPDARRGYAEASSAGGTLKVCVWHQALDARWRYAEASSVGEELKVCGGIIDSGRRAVGVGTWRRHRGIEFWRCAAHCVKRDTRGIINSGDVLQICGGIERWRRAEGMHAGGMRRH